MKRTILIMLFLSILPILLLPIVYGTSIVKREFSEELQNCFGKFPLVLAIFGFPHLKKKFFSVTTIAPIGWPVVRSSRATRAHANCAN
jgi:hypothetical protein